MTTRAITQPPSVPGPAYVCELQHRTPYYGGPIRRIDCPHHIARTVRCSRPARVEEVPPTKG